MKILLKKILAIITILALIIFGLYHFRYGKSSKQYSLDGQYSFYYKRSLLGITLMSMPGDGDIGSGTIYVYDELEEKVIFQFESSWVKSDMEASEFSKLDGGFYSCKSGHSIKLPRPLH